MALLKHPLTRLGLDPFAARRAARALEIAAFRTAYLGEGPRRRGSSTPERAARETAARKRRDRAVNRRWPADWDGARDLMARLKLAVAPLTPPMQAGPQSLANFARAHVAAAEAIARLPAEGRGRRRRRRPLWQGEAGEEGTRFLPTSWTKAWPALESRLPTMPIFIAASLAP